NGTEVHAAGNVTLSRNAGITPGTADVVINGQLQADGAQLTIIVRRSLVLGASPAALTAGSGTATLTAELGAINGSGLLTATTAGLSAATGIGNTTPLNLAASGISAGSTNGDVKLNNNLSAAVSVTNLSTGMGAVTFAQS